MMKSSEHLSGATALKLSCTYYGAQCFSVSKNQPAERGAQNLSLNAASKLRSVAIHPSQTLRIAFLFTTHTQALSSSKNSLSRLVVVAKCAMLSSMLRLSTVATPALMIGFEKLLLFSAPEASLHGKVD